NVFIRDPKTDKKYFKDIPVEEGRVVEDEILGISDGTPNQIFQLAHPELILRSLGKGQDIQKDIFLIVKIGEKIDKWNLQETLAFSRDEQKDYVIEIDEEDRAMVIFGDGAFGAIPASGAIVKATYRIGGGSHGNVAANTIETIVDAPHLALLGAKVTNAEPSTGGAERESIEHAVLHAPSVFRSLKRAVTTDDYKALALDFKGVGKVRAEATNWNTVTLFIAPEGGGYVSDVLKANLLAYFEDKRPVTTIVEIENVDYVKIYVTAKVGVSSYYSKEDIKQKVKEAAGSLLGFDRVDFAQLIYLSKFYEAIEAIEGIEYVNINEFRRQGQEVDTVEPEGKIELGSNEIPRIPDDPDDDPDYANGIKVVILEGGI
ncbi:MAG: baseplate J/gp47 family protein, partial [Proteobacteria bacterium]|nr:baseplate J/gp47 family protein [Pseudomonadota bacterium]